MKQTKLNSFFQNKNTVNSNKKTIKVKKYKQTKLINEDILSKKSNNSDISNNNSISINNSISNNSGINTDNAIKEKQKKKIKFLVKSNLDIDVFKGKEKIKNLKQWFLKCIITINQKVTLNQCIL